MPLIGLMVLKKSYNVFKEEVYIRPLGGESFKKKT